MKNALAIEWLKIKKYRTFWILAAFFIVLLPLWNYQISSGMIKMGGGKNSGVNIFNQAYSFPGVWANVGFWGSIFVLFLSILVIILTTNEYTFRTHRQNIIDGWSRMRFFHAKVWLVVLLSLSATVYLFLNGLLFGLSKGGSISGVFEKGEQLFYFFLLTLNYLGFALFISIWIKRSGLSIGIFILYTLMLENIIKGLVNWSTKTDYGNFLPLQSSDELLPFPLMEMAAKMMQTETLPMTSYVIASVVWCGVYYFAGKALLKRRDW